MLVGEVRKLRQGLTQAKSFGQREQSTPRFPLFTAKQIPGLEAPLALGIWDAGGVPLHGFPFGCPRNRGDRSVSSQRSRGGPRSQRLSR